MVRLHFLISIVQIGAVISLLGAGKSLVVYTAKKIQINSTLFALTLITGLISSAIIFFIFKDFGTSFLLMGFIIFALISSELVGKKLFRTNAKLLIIQRILMVVFSLILYFSIGESGIIIGMALSYLVYIPKISSGLKENQIKLILVRERFNFIFANYGNSLILSLSRTLDKILIGPFLGFVVLGNYSLGLQFFSLLVIIPMVVFQYLLPHEANGVENKRLKKIVVFTSIGLSSLGFSIGPEIIPLFFSKFSDGADVLRIMSLAVVPHTITLLY